MGSEVRPRKRRNNFRVEPNQHVPIFKFGQKKEGILPRTKIRILALKHGNDETGQND